MNREITLALHENFHDVVADTAHHANNCVGYMAMWAIHNERYSGKMTIYGDKEGNLHATYRNKAGDVTYNIFGQRGDDGTYSTHS